jgi:hypothetical protein
MFAPGDLMLALQLVAGMPPVRLEATAADLELLAAIGRVSIHEPGTGRRGNIESGCWPARIRRRANW